MSDAPEAAAAAPARKGAPIMLIGVISGVAIIQGATLFFVFKMLGGGPAATHAQTAPPEPAHGDTAADPHAAPSGEAHGAAGQPGAHDSAPHGAAAAESPAIAITDDLTEVTITRPLRVPNGKSGRITIFDIEVSVVVPAPQAEAVKALADSRASEIADRVARVVRAANDAILREDDLGTIRRQIGAQMNEVFGNDKLVQRVLLPRFVPMPN